MKPDLARLTLLSALTFLLMTPSSPAFDFSKVMNSVTEHTLDNGLTVLVMERHDAPVASFCTYANVGSGDDPKGYTGLAHMFEHMAFKGTTTLGTKDIDKELQLIAVEDSVFMLLRAERNKGRFVDSARVKSLEEAYEAAREASYELVEPNKFGNVIEREGGVGLNAFTSLDETVYFFSLPSNKVELWMALESERFLNPVLREMYKERDVVAEERRMRTDSNPIGRLIEEFLSIAFKAHPYGIPGVGHMSDIQYYSREEATAFFDKYYGPSNLVISIVGDVKTKDVIKLAEKYWGRIDYRPAPQRIATVEPEQLGERRTTLEDPSQPFYIAGWHIPEMTHPDRPAIDALLDYLGQGRTSALYKNLVKEKKAALQVGAFSGFPGNKYPTLMAVYTMPTQGHTNEECETEIFAEVEKLQNELIPVEEMDKIKARAKASFIRQLNSNQGFALQLAGFQTHTGNWREMFNELDRINRVTPEEIQRVAKQYLTKKNRVVAAMNTIES
ncbi:MAG: M16 family metallopeptidase [Candidatus Zixiibacteriota bacterium]